MSIPILTVVVPVFNEEATLERLLLSLIAAQPDSKQVVVVDDGSSDRSFEIASRLSESHPIDVLKHPKNRGKGAAIRTGLELAKGKYVIVQDADLEYDTSDINKLLQPLLRGEADVVFGSRYLDPNQKRSFRMADPGIWLLNFLVRTMYGLKLTDEATCYKLFETATMRKMDLQCSRFEFCPEVTAKAARMGLRLIEIPISYSPRSKEDGKKLRMTDGIEAIRELMKWRRWKEKY
jgi:dolichol-phosphate mannosyltransferase